MTFNMFKFTDLAGRNFNPISKFQRLPKIGSQQSSSEVPSKKRNGSRCPTRNQQKQSTNAVLSLSENSSYPEHKVYVQFLLYSICYSKYGKVLTYFIPRN